LLKILQRHRKFGVKRHHLAFPHNNKGHLSLALMANFILSRTQPSQLYCPVSRARSDAGVGRLRVNSFADEGAAFTLNSQR
jgi:hypothetical protein